MASDFAGMTLGAGEGEGSREEDVDIEARAWRSLRSRQEVPMEKKHTEEEPTTSVEEGHR